MKKRKSLRKILNFGHTFAHAYESTLNYSKRLNHGEAVFLGIYSAINFSLKFKLLSKLNYLRLKIILSNINFQIKLLIIF